jgi:hypothetical protein
MGNVQVGGKVPKGSSRSRIERPFAGVIAGLSINRLRVLDVAAERDPQITIRGDVQLVTGVLDRSNDLQRMQQVRILNERQLISYYDFISERHATATTFIMPADKSSFCKQLEFFYSARFSRTDLSPIRCFTPLLFSKLHFFTSFFVCN